MLNPRRRAKRRSGNPTKVIVIRTQARRRRNAALPAFAPAVQSNPHYRRRSRGNPRRRRRSNPRRVVLRRSYRSNPFDLRMLFDVGIRAGGAAVASYFLNKSVISALGVNQNGTDSQYGVWIRNLARVALSAAGVAWVGGTLGAAFAGSMLYPAVFEMDNWWRRQGTPQAQSGATDRPYSQKFLGEGAGSSEELSAALEAALNDYQPAY